MADDKLDLLLEGMGELRQITRAILDRQDETDAKLEALAMDVHQLRGEVAGIKENVASLKEDVATLKEDVTELKDGQERHERILETLALRALEWDAYRREQAREK